MPCYSVIMAWFNMFSLWTLPSFPAPGADGAARQASCSRWGPGARCGTKNPRKDTTLPRASQSSTQHAALSSSQNDRCLMYRFGSLTEVIPVKLQTRAEWYSFHQRRSESIRLSPCWGCPFSKPDRFCTVHPFCGGPLA